MRLSIISLLLLGCISIPAQTLQQKEPPEDKCRTVFLGAGIGYVNVFKIQLGWQINKRYSIAPFINIYPGNEGTQPNIFGVWGLKASVYFEMPLTFLKFNSINLEGGYFYSVAPLRAVEITLSREGISRQFINGYYSIGLGYYTTESRKSIFGPSIKVGFNINI